MSDNLEVQVTSRSVFGKGASRRLRRENLVPGIVYGANEEPTAINLKHNEVLKFLEKEAFYTQLLQVSVDGGESVRCILRDVQRHPAKLQILHMDFQRVVAGEELTTNASLHFINEETCVGVKSDGGLIAHHDTEVAISCRPRDIPDYIEVDVANLSVGDSIHLSDLVMPEGVRLLDLNEKGDDSDRAVVSVTARKGGDTEESDDSSEEEAASEGGDE